ncbi:MAG: cobaltochelatase subunit CobN [Rhodomicrobium sp.]
MHLIVRDGASLDEIGEPQDLGLAPADFILLSFSDSDLATFRAALKSPLTLPLSPRGERTPEDRSSLEKRAAASSPSPLGERAGVRGSFSAHFINLAALRHPISADLFIEKTVPGTKAILLRLLGGLDYWRYGAEELAHACRKHGVTLAVLSGDGRADPRLPPLSTTEAAKLDALDRLLGAGGPQNAGLAISALMSRGGGHSSSPVEALPESGVYRETGPVAGGSVAIIFYRSFLLASDVRPIDALFDILAQRPSPCPSPSKLALASLLGECPYPQADADGRGGAFSMGATYPLSYGERAGVRGGTSELGVRAYYVPSLKAARAAEWLREEFRRNPPDAIVNTTAFSARGEDTGSPLDGADCPVIQAAMAGSSEEAWRKSARALSSTDLAMHVVLPEIDGRIFAGAISFKDRDASGAVFHRPQAQGIEHVASLASAWLHLRRTARQDRKLALILSTYPGRPDQIAHAVGLDGPASALKLAQHLQAEGYSIEGLPSNAGEMMEPFVSFLAALPLTPTLSQWERGQAAASELASPLTWGEGQGEGVLRYEISWPLSEYEAALAQLPESLREAVISAWGVPKNDPAFASGAIALPVSAYGDLLICLQPERGHVTDRKSSYHDPNLPPRHAYIAFYLWLRERARVDALIHLGAHGTLEWLSGKATALSEACAPRALLGPVPVVYPFIVNDPGEAAQAKRRISAVTIGHNTPPLIETGSSPALREIERLLDEYSAAEGLDKRRRERLALDILGAVTKGGLEEACGIKPEMTGAEALMRVDAFLCDVKALAIRDGLHTLDETELAAISRALDGRFIEPGPSGAPSRSRADVLPTGRNLYSVDPRTIPTPLACENGARMADAIVARYVEDHGDWPRSMVLDLWGSQTMRTGGEEIGTALALLGVKPVWDYASFRVTGFEIVPLMKLNRPRVDVTLRISGLLRDMFPAQLAFFHTAVQRVAAREEPPGENPLRRQQGEIYRIFGAADGAYGAGVSQRIDAGDWQTPADLAESYLEASSTAYTGESDGVAARAAFEQRVKAAEGFVHVQDHRETDVLSSLDFAAHEGGFAAAALALGNGQAAVYHADAATPRAPRIRTLAEEAARVLHGRALSGKWLEGQMRHGFRGAAEIAGTADAAFAFAATAGAIGSEGLEHLYEAYLGDPTVASFLARENSAALAALQSRFKEAIERSLWKPRRNDLSGLKGGGIS